MPKKKKILYRVSRHFFPLSCSTMNNEYSTYTTLPTPLVNALCTLYYSFLWMESKKLYRYEHD